MASTVSVENLIKEHCELACILGASIRTAQAKASRINEITNNHSQITNNHSLLGVSHFLLDVSAFQHSLWRPNFGELEQIHPARTWRALDLLERFAADHEEILEEAPDLLEQIQECKEAAQGESGKLRVQ